MENAMATEMSNATMDPMGSSNKKEKKYMPRRKKRMIFYVLFWIFPIIHFSIFYVAVNLSYFTMAFQEYSYATDGSVGYVIEFVGFKHFKTIFSLFANAEYLEMLLNSFIMYGVGFFTGTVLSVLFSFIFKPSFC